MPSGIDASQSMVGVGMVFATEHELDGAVPVIANTESQRRTGQHGCRQEDHQDNDGYDASPKAHFLPSYLKLVMQS